MYSPTDTVRVYSIIKDFLSKRQSGLLKVIQYVEQQSVNVHVVVLKLPYQLFRLNAQRDAQLVTMETKDKQCLCCWPQQPGLYKSRTHETTLNTLYLRCRSRPVVIHNRPQLSCSTNPTASTHQLVY